MKKDGGSWPFCRKSKVFPVHTMKERGEAQQIQLHSSMTLILDGGEMYVVDLTNFHVMTYLFH
jgi:hypothetical protein